MSETFRKRRAGAPHGFFACEAAGLRWLRVPGGPAVVEVLDAGPDHLDLERLTETRPTPAAATDFGRRLAVLHDSGAPAFGSPPEGWAGDGFFGPMDQPYPMPAGEYDSWGAFLATCRIAPLAELLGGHDGLDRLAAELAAGRWDDDDHPARLHGDLWSGNVLWTAGGATLIDPAAHGGHRETDLAMLALFGLPYLAEVLAGYQQVHPLRRGWQYRVGLHQVYPVGMHAVLFGGGYRAQLDALVTAALART
ncbi:fructosamine kinase family protein [Cellulomonas denverensis]|uniref:Phosphotransferase n=1 Tax=Cellulomonas denverensis TaxID=264297 RepID=A0A7X6KTS6_9CELL|nr:fructosamine kinase family protein [Cellulomonas denverensis]NKY22161.1 phosphotransferase [Cellulomonas denverensis]GIG27366.1 fructosamine kinase [Cellulomonas denverensis]